MNKKFAILFGALVCAGAHAQVSTLSASIAVDNGYDAYLSTSATTLGTLFLSGANWQATQQGSIGIPSGGTYYLHIRCIDVGLPAMFIGEFSLTGSNASFARNGTTNLKSSLTNFTASGGPLPGDSFADAFDRGANGASPWSLRPDIAADARFLWARHATGAEFTGSNDPLYFTTEIRAVPEPATMLGLAAGAALLLRRKARR